MYFNQKFYIKEYFNSFFRGFYSYFRLFLSFLGIGYKRFFCFSSIILKLGFSHRLLYVTRLDFKVLLFKRRKIELRSRNLNLLNFFSCLFEKTRLPNKYKKKGIFLKGSRIFLRLSSKKSKF